MISGVDRSSREIARYRFDVVDMRDRDDLLLEISDELRIGLGAMILKGVKLGQGWTIGAGSVIAERVLPYAVVAGNTARMMRMPFDEPRSSVIKRFLVDDDTCSRARFAGWCGLVPAVKSGEKGVTEAGIREC